MSDTTRCFIDILSRLLDPPVQRINMAGVPVKRQVGRDFAQLPWPVETALIRYLYAEAPDLFDEQPQDRWPGKTYINAEPPPSLANKGPYHVGPSFMTGYKLSRRYYEGLNLARESVEAVSPLPTVREWLAANDLYATHDDNPDPHFAERAFVINVLAPAYGLDVLAHLEAQRMFPEWSYQVDFQLRTCRGPVLIEVDGREYHDPIMVGAQRWEYELERQNRLQSLRIPLFRYPARRILYEPESVVSEVRGNIGEVPQVPVQMELFEDEVQPEPDDTARLIHFASEYCRWFRPVQLGILLSLSRALGKPSFRIAERCAPPGMLEMAVSDLSLLVAKAQQLYDVSLPWPGCIHLWSMADAPAPLMLAFTEAMTAGPDRLADAGAFQVTVAPGVEHEDSADLIVDLEREGRIPLVPEGDTADVLGVESENLSTLRLRHQALCLERPGVRNPLRPLSLEKPLLDYFARRFLGIPALFHHHNPDPNKAKTEERQYELVCRVLRGQSSFGIMPTGRGKSVAFQLPAILLPGGALVISPLRALMRDQLDDLRWDRGFNCVDNIRYGMGREEKERALDDFVRGYSSLLYVSPERLQELRFSQRLPAAAAAVHVSFLAVDEAHCVSEWGHDFRISYMHIPVFAQKLAEMQEGEAVPILALTATASPPVRRDVCAILSLCQDDAREGGDLVAEENIDRTELSLSVHPVEGISYPEDRQRELVRVLTQALPRALDRNHGFRWREFASGGWRGKGAAVIFCLYKDAHGQTAWHDGVGAVRDFLVTSQVVPENGMRLYAAEAPGRCPECVRDGLPPYTYRGLLTHEQEEVAEQYECANGHLFSVADAETKWETYISTTQYEFKANEYPLLISTKAYGMGIDHRGLRFVVHYGLPSSLESYYQEIGRAGRDGEQAHCALLVRLPVDDCLARYVDQKKKDQSVDPASDQALLPPCLRGVYFQRRQCPPEIGLPEPCDLSRQLRMVLQSYVQPEGFAQSCAEELWEPLSNEEPGPDGTVRWYVHGGGYAGNQRLQKTQNQLFRLQQLGLVSGFFLEYVWGGDAFDVAFHVSLCERVNSEAVWRRLVEQIARIEAANPDPDAAAGFRGQVGEALPGFGQYEVSAAGVREAVSLLFGAVRRYVLNMRIVSFRNLLEYVQCTGGCRRTPLLDFMSETAHYDPNHRCGFCDLCVGEELGFARELAKPAEGTGQYADILAAERHAFQTGEFGELGWALSEAERRGILESLARHAATEVEHDPSNLAANYAAGVAYSKSREDTTRRSAHRFFRQYAEVANVKRGSEDDARRGYGAYKDFDVTEAIREYAAAGAAFDNLADLRTMDADAAGSKLTAAERTHLKIAHLAGLTAEVAGSFDSALRLADELIV